MISNVFCCFFIRSMEISFYPFLVPFFFFQEDTNPAQNQLRKAGKRHQKGYYAFYAGMVLFRRFLKWIFKRKQKRSSREREREEKRKSNSRERVAIMINLNISEIEIKYRIRNIISNKNC